MIEFYLNILFFEFLFIDEKQEREGEREGEREREREREIARERD